MTEFVRSALPRYGRVPRELLRDPEISAQAVRLYGLLDDYAGPDGRAFPSRATLAAVLGSTATVDRAKRELEDGGWLIRQQRARDDGGQTSTLFLLTAGPSPETRGVITGDEGGSSRVTTQEGEPDEGDNPPSPPQAGGVEPGLFDVAPVGGVSHNGNMSTPTATRSGRRREVPDDDPQWVAFWETCHRKIGKGAARKAWTRAIQKADPTVITEAMAQAAADYRAREKREPVRDGLALIKFEPHPSTWLNQERWSDEREAERVRKTGVQPPRKEDECPIHAGQWKDSCKGCAADAKAKKD